LCGGVVAEVSCWPRVPLGVNGGRCDTIGRCQTGFFVGRSVLCSACGVAVRRDGQADPGLAGVG
jgi:hypothetical protein